MIELRNVTSDNKWMQLDMHFHDNTNSSLEAEGPLQLVSRLSRVILISGRDLHDVHGRGSLSHPPRPLSRRTIRSWFIPGAAGRSDKGATRTTLLLFSIYRRRRAARRGWRHILRRGKPRTGAARGCEAHRIVVDANFCNWKAWGNNVPSYARKKSCAKKARVFSSEISANL